jgi:hypothetical protein
MCYGEPVELAQWVESIRTPQQPPAHQQLHYTQAGSHIEPEQLTRLTPCFDLERGYTPTTQQQHDPKTPHTVQKNERDTSDVRRAK